MNKKFSFFLMVFIMVGSGLGALPAYAEQHAVGTNIITPQGTVFTITQKNGQTVRRPYTSPGAFLSFSFNTWDSIRGASAEDMALPEGSFIAPQDGKIICSDRGTDKGTCYLITNSKKAGFTSADVFKKFGYDFNHVMSGDVSFLPSTSNIDTATIPHQPGTLINKDGTVYVVGKNGLLGVPDWNTLQSWGYISGDVVAANAADRQLPVAGTLAVRHPEQLAVKDTENEDQTDHSGQPAPQISTQVQLDSVTPNQALPGDTVHLVIKGSGFLATLNQSGNALPITPDLQLHSSKFVSDSEIDAEYYIPKDATIGTVQFSVLGSNTLLFTINSPGVPNVATSTPSVQPVISSLNNFSGSATVGAKQVEVLRFSVQAPVDTSAKVSQLDLEWGAPLPAGTLGNLRVVTLPDETEMVSTHEDLSTPGLDGTVSHNMGQGLWNNGVRIDAGQSKVFSVRFDVNSASVPSVQFQLTGIYYIDARGAYIYERTMVSGPVISIIPVSVNQQPDLTLSYASPAATLNATSTVQKMVDIQLTNHSATKTFGLKNLTFSGDSYDLWKYTSYPYLVDETGAYLTSCYPSADQNGYHDNCDFKTTVVIAPGATKTLSYFTTKTNVAGPFKLKVIGERFDSSLDQPLLLGGFDAFSPVINGGQ